MQGARFEFNKTLTQKFALTHNISMGSAVSPGGYEFGANFGDESILLQSRVNMSGELTGRVNAQLTDSLLARFQGQCAPGGGASGKLDLDYKGGGFSAGCGNISHLHDCFLVVLLVCLAHAVRRVEYAVCRMRVPP